MALVFDVVLPVFTVILLGWLAPWFRLINAAGMRGLTDFAFFVALPALLFNSVATAGATPVAGVAGVYFASCLVVYALAMLLARLLFGAGLAEAAMFALNATFGNTVFMGIPIVGAVFGPRAVVYLLAIIAFHSALLLPLAALLIELGSHRRGDLATVFAAVLGGLVRNPVIVAIVAAFFWRLSGLALPGPLHQLLTILANAAPALALFCLGGALPEFGFALAAPQVVLTTALKLAVLPLVVAGIARFMGLSDLPFAVAVLTAAMPTGANAFLMARRTATLAQGSAAAVALSTLVSLLGVGVLVAVLR